MREFDEVAGGAEGEAWRMWEGDGVERGEMESEGEAEKVRWWTESTTAR